MSKNENLDHFNIEEETGLSTQEPVENTVPEETSDQVQNTKEAEIPEAEESSKPAEKAVKPKEDVTILDFQNLQEDITEEEKPASAPAPSLDDTTEIPFSSREPASFEMDAFSRALLNRKTEMSLFEEEQASVIEEPKLTPEEWAQVNQTMASALDQLRVQRGQVPIDQEEEDYQWSKTVKFEDRFGQEEEDFTTASLFKKEPAYTPLDEQGLPKSGADFMESMESRPQQPQKANASWFAVIKEKFAGTKDSSSKAKPAAKEQTAAKEQPASAPSKSQPKPEAKPVQNTETASAGQMQNTAEMNLAASAPKSKAQSRKKRRVRKQAVYILIGFFAVILLLFGGYAYKVLVYDPANAISEEQQADYDWLVDYAEGYDMALEGEKLELLSREDGYNNLTEKQKKQIDEIFVQFTGYNVPDLIQYLKENSLIDDENNREFLDLLTFINGYAEMDELQQNSLRQYLDVYNRLSDSLKGTINNAMNAQAGTDFMGQYEIVMERSEPESEVPEQTTEEGTGTETPVEDETAADESQNDPNDPAVNVNPDQAEIDALMAEIEALQIDRDNYAAFLQEEGMPLTGDETLMQYDASIANRQQLLDTLLGQ